MGNLHLKITLMMAVILVGCSPGASPESNLIGKWQSEAVQKRIRAYQFQFFADGSVAYSELENGKWQQMGAGTFKFVDKTHVKIELSPSWYFGATIHELSWQDQNHVTLREGDTSRQLARIK